MAQDDRTYQQNTSLPPFYTWLRQTRKPVLHLSQEALAEELGVSRGTIAGWENGDFAPDVQSLALIATYFKEKGISDNIFADVRPIAKQKEMERLAQEQKRLPEPPALSSHGSAPPAQEIAPLPLRILPFRTHLRKTFGPPSLLIILVILLVVVIFGVLSVYLSTSLTSLSPKSSMFVGQVRFLSSGLIEENSPNGIADRIQIDVQGISPPGPHKHYYGWLTSNAPESPGIFLGKLPVAHGEIHYLYNGDDTHTNLLNTATNLTITEEDDYGNTQPLGLTLDKHTWRFAASIPDDHPADQQFGLRDHIQHLFAVDGTLYKRGLYGGLLLWLNRAIEENWHWAFQARQQFLSNASAASIREPLVNMLTTLDGANMRHGDMPPQPVFLTGLDRRSAVFPILPQGPQPPISESSITFEEASYISHVDLHLRGIHALTRDTQIRTQAQHVLDALTSTTATLTSARDIVKQLLKMTDTQLVQHNTLFLLDTLLHLVEQSYVGPQGIYQIASQVQQLATMDIHSYS